MLHWLLNWLITAPPSKFLDLCIVFFLVLWKKIFIRNGEFNYEANRVAVSGTTCRLAHLPRYIILEQSVGVGASNARCYRYCSFCCSFPLFLSFSISLPGPLSFSRAVHIRDVLFHVEPLGPPGASRSLRSFARRFRCISKQVPGRTFQTPQIQNSTSKDARIQVNKHSTLQKLEILHIGTCEGPNTYEGQTCLNELGWTRYIESLRPVRAIWLDP